MIFDPFVVMLGLIVGSAILFGPVRALVPPGHRDRVSSIIMRYLLYGWLLGALFFMPTIVLIQGVTEGSNIIDIAGLTPFAFVAVPTAGNMFFVAFAAVGFPAAAVAGVLHAATVVRCGSLGWIGAMAIGIVSSGVGWLVIGRGIVDADRPSETVAWFTSGLIATLLLRWGDDRRVRRRSV